MQESRLARGWAFRALLVVTAAISAALIAVAATAVRGRGPDTGAPNRIPPEHQSRYQLFEELRPVALANCTLERFGEEFDGGYLMCGNLLDGARAAYSYGISGYDGWGCDTAARLSATTHQYDCFNVQQPTCTKGTTVFHPLCIAGEAKVDQEGRTFQSLEQQLADNDHAESRVVVKMDVEGAEWESLLRTPEAVLQHVDQLVLVSQLNVAAIRQTRRWLDFLKEEGLYDLPVSLVLNRYVWRLSERARLRQAIRALDHPIDHYVPDDTALALEAINRGTPLFELRRRAKLCRSLRQVTAACVTMIQQREQAATAAAQPA
jgi:hypothetical protein